MNVATATGLMKLEKAKVTLILQSSTLHDFIIKENRTRTVAALESAIDDLVAFGEKWEQINCPATKVSMTFYSCFTIEKVA